MSNCLIRIRIGDQEILLDPGADISANDAIPLANTIPVDKLRNIYNQLKDNLAFDTILESRDLDLIKEGKVLYKEILEEATVRNQFTTLLGAIKKEKDTDKLKALVAYASSLNTKEVLTHGNFAIDAGDSH